MQDAKEREGAHKKKKKRATTKVPSALLGVGVGSSCSLGLILENTNLMQHADAGRCVW
jgi:hypothetical protein